MAMAHRTSPTTEDPVWFSTGCSTGFGRELATPMLERGYRTVVTARNPDEVGDLAAKGEALLLTRDVTDQDQIDAAIKTAEERCDRIVVLVTHAGIGYLRPLKNVKKTKCADCARSTCSA